VSSRAVREAICDLHARFVSESIQRLVHELGTDLLRRFGGLAEVSFAARNMTRDPLTDTDADADVRVFTDPFPAFGTIRLTLRR
jgi:urate oxidase